MSEVGDLVFAKVKGHRHPHWPAVIIDKLKLDKNSPNGISKNSPNLDKNSHKKKSKTGVQIQSDQNGLLWGKCEVNGEAPCDKFNVKFFGTNQTAVINADLVVLYDDESLERFNTAKNRKHRFFKDALAEIEERKSQIQLKRITRSAAKNRVSRKRPILKVDVKEEDGLRTVLKSSKSTPDGLHKTPPTEDLPGSQLSLKSTNLSCPLASVNSSLDHPEGNKTRTDSLSSSLPMPMDINLSSPSKSRTLPDPSSTPLAIHPNYKDIPLSSPFGNHHEVDQDTPVSTPVLNNHNLRDVFTFSPMINHLSPKSMSESFPMKVHDQQDLEDLVSPNLPYDYDDQEKPNHKCPSSVPEVNDDTLDDSTISSKHRYDFRSKLTFNSIGEDDHKTSNETETNPIKSSRWNSISKKRKLTMEDDIGSNRLWKKDRNSSQLMDAESSVWADETLNESSLWMDEHFEEPFSCEENPCELSWIEPSLPQDSDDYTSDICDDIKKLFIEQNTFDKLDDTNDTKVEAIASEPSFSDSDCIQPRNSDPSEHNILNSNCDTSTELKLSNSDPGHFISNFLTGLIGYIIDAFFDDDFSAYCCDELFSVDQLEEHIKKFHQHTPANVTIKTAEW